MKRLLAISWEMPPIYGPRAMQVTRVLGELPALGWSPAVVCMDPRRGGPEAHRLVGEPHVDVNCSQQPLLAPRVHAQCDCRARGERCAQQLIRRRARILAPYCSTFIGHQPMMTCKE